MYYIHTTVVYTLLTPPDAPDAPPDACVYTYPGAFSINGNSKTLEGTTDNMGQLISPPNDVLSGHHGVEVRVLGRVKLGVKIGVK